ncbi:hypothetical protein BA190_19115 [Labrys sp. WJW]|uniref:hypothetical protein n=1 Tax=Labrys sp. WJW TaxID=1737983 RepID=UPI00082D6AFC|nr:hypothetical protein [Labrys sp. WJW]OCC03308.1 hypothetical protein BA190_19115 [Labrys sp. WJW]
MSLRDRAVAGVAVEHGGVAWTMAFRLPVFDPSLMKAFVSAAMLSCFFVFAIENFIFRFGKNEHFSLELNYSETTLRRPGLRRNMAECTAGL